MAIREVTMYQVACDEPDCKVPTGPNDPEYFCWGDVIAAEDDWEDGGCQKTPEGKHYCDDHRKPECCGCDKTQGLVYRLVDDDWYCLKHLAEELA